VTDGGLRGLRTSGRHRDGPAEGLGIGVIWDLDGTLADTEDAHFRAWGALLREHGRELTWEAFKPTFGLSNPNVLQALLDPSLSEIELEGLSRHKESIFRARSRGAIRAMPGALALVRHLQALGVPQAVGTSAPPENIPFVLGALGVEDAFPVTVARVQVERGKPFPDNFVRAAERLQVPPSSCVVLEDAPAGIEAAKAGGMRCIALASTWDERALREADVVVRDLSTVCWPLQQWQDFARGAWGHDGR